MRDIYLYSDVAVLKNKLGIKNQEELDGAEADYCAMRLRELAETPLPGKYDAGHFLSMHHYIFQDLYDWAGEPRKTVFHDLGDHSQKEHLERIVRDSIEGD